MENLRLIQKSKICFMEIDGVWKHSQFHCYIHSSSYKIRSQYIATPLFIQHHFILFDSYRSNIEQQSISTIHLGDSKIKRDQSTSMLSKQQLQLQTVAVPSTHHLISIGRVVQGSIGRVVQGCIVRKRRCVAGQFLFVGHLIALTDCFLCFPTKHQQELFSILQFYHQAAK